jgi:hypothetical protein
MKAKEAKTAKIQEKIQNAMHAPGEIPAAVAGTGDAPSAEVQKAAVPPANVNEDTEEIPIAGRTKMTVPKKGQDTDIQKEDKTETSEMSEEDKERAEKEKKESEANTELNDILKRAPGVFPSLLIQSKADRSSHYLLQILLSLQQESEVNPAGALLYPAEAVRCRIGPAPTRSIFAGFVGAEHWTTDCA